MNVSISLIDLRTTLLSQYEITYMHIGNLNHFLRMMRTLEARDY